MVVQLSSQTDLLGNDVADVPIVERDALAAALYAQMKDLTLDEFAALFVNRFDAMIDYVKLCAGEKTGQRISLLFNQHRLDTGTKRFPISLYAALKDPKFINGLARVVILNQSRGVKDLLYQSVGMGVQGTSYVQEFPPHVARDLALEYNLSKSSCVLDLCAGWGGRMLGFSAVVDSYAACEPSARTFAGLAQLLTFIRSFRRDFCAELHEAPFEDVSFADESFDFAMTSPPYYDTETYAPGENQNSHNRYASFAQWVDGFYAPLIHKTMRALKPGAAFVLNIGSRTYPLNDELHKIASGKYRVEKQRGKLSASSGLGKTDGKGETFYEITNPQRTMIAITSFADQFVESAVKELTSEVNKLTDAAHALADAQSDAVKQTTQHTSSALALALSSANAAESTSERAVETNAAVSKAELVNQLVSNALKETDAVADGQIESLDALAERLKTAGHQLLTRDGALFISESSKLSDADRAAVKANKSALIARATYWPRVEQSSLASFLGTREEKEPDWIAKDPPRLSDVKNVVVNFETNGLKWWAGDEPIGVTVGALDGSFSQYLPFAHRGRGNLDKAAVVRYLQTELRDKHITNANTRFDVHMGRVLGVDLEQQGNTVSDVMHYAALLDDHRKQFKIDVLAKDFLGGVEVERVDERFMQDYEAHEVARRAEYQATLVSQLHRAMWPQLDAQDLQRVRQLEDDVIYTVVEMEKNGAQLDLELLDRYHAECASEHDRLMQEISSECGFAFEHTSSGWQRLFEKLQLASDYVTATGKPSFAEDVVSRVEHPLVQKARYASQLASLDSKTFAAYKKLVDSDGILRFDINQLRGDDGGTVSGRFSIGYVQQVPNAENHRRVFGEKLNPRDLFIARDGAFLAADAAQIEFRLFAHHAKNAKILSAYAADPTVSFHRLLHSMLLPFRADLGYGACKNLNFATIYGAGVVKTALMMGFISQSDADEINRVKSQRSDARLAAARDVKAIYDRELPEVAPLLKRAAHLAMSECDEYCNKTAESRKLHRLYEHRGYVKTLLGRRSRFPHNYSLHKALNRVIQGTAADIMKQKLVELHRKRRETGLLLRMSVHDEVCGDVADAEGAQRVATVLNKQSFNELTVPILWEVKTGKNWAECK